MKRRKLNAPKSQAILKEARRRGWKIVNVRLKKLSLRDILGLPIL